MDWEDDIENPETKKTQLEKILIKNPNDSFTHYRLGVMYSFLKDSKQAAKCCDKAIELDPENALYYAFRMFVSSPYENKAESERLLDCAVKLIVMNADESDYDVELAIDRLDGVDRQALLDRVAHLRDKGKANIAIRLLIWALRLSMFNRQLIEKINSFLVEKENNGFIYRINLLLVSIKRFFYGR